MVPLGGRGKAILLRDRYFTYEVRDRGLRCRRQLPSHRLRPGNRIVAHGRHDRVQHVTVAALD
jgi:hypothetical protein